MKRFQKASPNFKFMRFQARINNMDFTLLAKELGIPLGVPTMKGAFGEPENTGVGYNTIITELGDHSVPKNWAQFVVKREPGETPGPPIIWSDPQNPEEVEAGYGFISDETTEEETFFYHSDHLGSTSYITDDKGNITQYTAYLPYGELLVDEHSSSEDLPYKFNGKELDEETGLYYYGARYMQPVASIWYGVDPLMEKYPNVSGYVYCLGNPVKLVDPDGHAVETIWDAANVVLGVGSFIDNVKQGNVGAAAIDGVGIVLDAAAVVVPGVPGGVGTAIKTYRATKATTRTVKASKTIKTVKNTTKKKKYQKF